MKNALLNHTAVRRYILKMAKDHRPGWNCTQVSGEALMDIELKVRGILERAVHQHPSRGKTFRGML